MVRVPVQTLTLETFLELSETDPASEFMNHQLSQKSMPQGEHSTLQSELVNAINAVGKPTRLVYAFPELRCVFGGAAIVPDVAIFRWPRIPRKVSGRIANRFDLYPDWVIEMVMVVYWGSWGDRGAITIKPSSCCIDRSADGLT